MRDEVMGRADFGWRVAVRRLRAGLIAAAVVSLMLNTLMLAVPIYSLQLFDRVLGSGSVETLILLSVVTGFALLCLGAFEMVRTSLLSRLATRFELALMRPTVEAGYTKGQAAAGVRDLSTVRQALSGPAVTALFDTPWLPGALVVIWMLHPTLCWFVAASALLLALFAIANDLLTRNAMRETGRRQLAAVGLVEAMQRKREAVTGLGMLDALLARLETVSRHSLVGAQTASERGGIVTGFTRTVRLAVQVGVMGLGAWLVLTQELSPGGMLAASILASKALAPVEQMVATWRTIGTARESWRRLQGLLGAVAPPVRTSLPEPTGRVHVEGVTVRAAAKAQGAGDASRILLRGVGLTLAPGECLVVVGPSGAGKTTLCRVLTGAVIPDAGAVRLDGGVLQHYPRAELGAHIGYLPQDTALFAGTVSENIARMAEGADPATVVAAAELAGAHEMILRLSDGYETRLEEGGFPLSGGQRQRVGLARAVYGSPKLVVLDEPNANLDGPGEAALTATIGRLKAARATVVIVTHRPQLLRLADRVLVLEQGAVAKLGPREEVMATLVRPAASAA